MGLGIFVALIGASPLWLSALTARSKSSAAKLLRIICLSAIAALLYFIGSYFYRLNLLSLPHSVAFNFSLGDFVAWSFLSIVPLLAVISCALLLIVMIGRDFHAWPTIRPKATRHGSSFDSGVGVPMRSRFKIVPPLALSLGIVSVALAAFAIFAFVLSNRAGLLLSAPPNSNCMDALMALDAHRRSVTSGLLLAISIFATVTGISFITIFVATRKCNRGRIFTGC